MEQRQDYMESQIDMLTKVLRKILEKLLKLKSSDRSETEMNNIISVEISENSNAITIDSLKQIQDTDLVKILVGQYSYTEESLGQLADILFELSRNGKTKRYIKQKALILYKHVVLDRKNNIDFLKFSRIKELEISLKQEDL
jgi:hypothetical protein